LPHKRRRSPKKWQSLGELARKQSEQRRVFGFVADTFKQFLEGRDAVDERSAKNIVTRAKSELAALKEANAAIRRIIGANPGQRTDDAVAQALIGRV
jgi:hypothetical protein